MPDARPRAEPMPYTPIQWPDGRRVQLMPRAAPLEVDLVSLFEQRQTRRNFSSNLALSELGDFLWLSCRSRSSRPSPYGPDQESRPHPSASALHPIHVFVIPDTTLLRYDPVGHALVELPSSSEGARQAAEAAQASLEVANGCVLALLAEPGKTGAKYEDPESLVLRDAGVVLGYMSVVAEALGLTFCPLGVTGHPDLTAGLPFAGSMRSVGLAVVGKAG